MSWCSVPLTDSISAPHLAGGLLGGFHRYLGALLLRTYWRSDCWGIEGLSTLVRDGVGNKGTWSFELVTFKKAIGQIIETRKKE